MLLAVFALDPASGSVILDAGGVDGDGDGFIRLPEASIGVDGEALDAFSDARAGLRAGALVHVCGGFWCILRVAGWASGRGILLLRGVG